MKRRIGRQPGAIALQVFWAVCFCACVFGTPARTQPPQAARSQTTQFVQPPQVTQPPQAARPQATRPQATQPPQPRQATPPQAAPPQATQLTQPREAIRPASVVVAFYNTENFFDTLPVPGGGDDPYTPKGSLRWDSGRYREKVTNIARVLDSLRADLVGLAEIENEAVLQDLVRSLKTSYNYIIEPGTDPRGINVALLYRGSLFFPMRTFQLKGPGLSRPVLAVTGRLRDDTVTVMVAHLPSLLNRTSWRRTAAQTLRNRLDEMRQRHPRGKIILMGDFNMSPGSALARKTLRVAPWPEARPTLADGPQGPIFTPFTTPQRRGEGSYVYRDRRYVYDYILLDGDWHHNPGWGFRGRYGIFSPDFLLGQTGPQRGYPRRTFERGHYTGGFSDHLPVWLVLER